MTTIRVDGEIVLRRPTLSNAEGVFALVDSNREHLGRWLPWVQTMRTVEDERRWLENRLQDSAESRDIQFLIMYQDTLVGVIGLHGLGSLNKACEIGYWLAENAQGRGIVTRACQELVNYAFTSRDMNSIQIRAHTDNARSRAIPERLGFTLKGVGRELLNDRYYDFAVYSMLASEWRHPGTGSKV